MNPFDPPADPNPFLARFGMRIVEGPVPAVNWTNPAEDFVNHQLLGLLADDDCPQYRIELPGLDPFPICASCGLEIPDDDWLEEPDQGKFHSACAPVYEVEQKRRSF